MQLILKQASYVRLLLQPQASTSRKQINSRLEPEHCCSFGKLASFAAYIVLHAVEHPKAIKLTVMAHAQLGLPQQRAH